MKTHPCVGCGYCCLKAPCIYAQQRFPGVTRCPDLFWDGDRYRCWIGMRFAEVGKELAIGEGCCSSMNSWRKEVKYRG